MSDKAQELYEAGQLSEAIEQLKQEVKSNPTDVGQRSFLFSLLCFKGEYQSAEKQLDVISLQSASGEAGSQVYLNVLAAEVERQRFFKANQKPHFLMQPSQYVQLYLDAVKALQSNQTEKVTSLLGNSEEKRPKLQGSLNGKKFSQFSESNDIIAPILELIIHDKYIWLQFEHIMQLQIEQPKKLQDLLWIAARFELRNGQAMGGYIPTRYLDSDRHENDQIKLGRMTDWKSVSEKVFSAVGQRMFFVDGEGIALLEVREINFDN